MEQKKMNIELFSDELMQAEINDREVKSYFQTEVIEGRHFNAMQTANGTIYISFYNFQTKGNMKPIFNMHLSPQSFAFLLEAMLHAEEKFGVDRKRIIKELAGGKGIKFKYTISSL